MRKLQHRQVMHLHSIPFGCFLSHRGTPSHHPFLDGIFAYKPSILGTPMAMETLVELFFPVWPMWNGVLDEGLIQFLFTEHVELASCRYHVSRMVPQVGSLRRRTFGGPLDCGASFSRGRCRAVGFRVSHSQHGNGGYGCYGCYGCYG